jgi:hypothetical protein
MFRRNRQQEGSPTRGGRGPVDGVAVVACATWTAIWVLAAIVQIVGSWSTLEVLQAQAAGTTTTITAPAPTPSPSASPAPSPSPSLTGTASPSPTSPSGTPATSGLTSTPSATPITTVAPGGPAQAAIPVLGRHVTGSLDLGLFLFALAFGALGATARCLWVFTGAIGGSKPDFLRYRIGWFWPQPPLGAILGALLWVTIRGGLLAASSGASAVNLFGVAAIGAAGGISAANAMKLLARALPVTPPSTPPLSTPPPSTPPPSTPALSTPPPSTPPPSTPPPSTPPPSTPAPSTPLTSPLPTPPPPT